MFAVWLVATPLDVAAMEEGSAAAQTSAAVEAPSMIWEVAKDGAVLAARLTPTTPRLSDELCLELTLQAPLEAAIGDYQAPQSLGDFRVLRSEPQAISLSPQADGATHRAILWLEPLRPGPSRLDGLRWPLGKSSTGDAASVATIDLPARLINIETTQDVSDASLDQLEPLEGPRQPSPTLARQPTATVWIAAVAALAGLGIAAYLLLKRRVADDPLEPPGDEALRRIDQLSSRSAASPARTTVMELSEVVRRFIERTTELDAPDLTTQEFIDRASEVFAEDDRQRLQRWLQQADEVKFAATSITPEELAAMVESARGFVRMRAEAKP